MASLNGTTPAATYPSLLKFDDNSAISAAKRLLSDGAGGASPIYLSNTQLNVGGTGIIDARIGIKGAGATSATFSLRAENSTNGQFLTYDDSGVLSVSSTGNIGAQMTSSEIRSNVYKSSNTGGGSSYLSFTAGACQLYNNGGQMSFNGTSTDARIPQSLKVGNNTATNAAAILELSSTTKGFLPPIMTTAQVNAIAAAPAGLTVYNTTLNVLCCYNGTGWFRVSMATAM